MQPGPYKLIARTNADLDETFELQDDDGNAVDTSEPGWDAIAQLRASPGSPPYLEMSVTNGRITIDDAGVVRILVPEEDMAGLGSFVGEWDLLIMQPNGEIDAELAGPAQVVRGISKIGGGT